MTQVLNIYDLKNDQLFGSKIKSISVLGEFNAAVYTNNSENNLNLRELHRKLIKNIFVYPPPEFVLKEKTLGQDLLIFLHEQFNEYCDEFMLDTIEAKFFVLLKVFEKDDLKMKDLRGRIKIFFECQCTELTNKSVDEKTIYLKLVSFLDGKYVNIKLQRRLEECSLLVYMNDTWNHLSYCTDQDNNIGLDIVGQLLENIKLLNCKDDIVNSFRDKFVIKHIVSQHISRDDLFNFAIRNDALHKDSLLTENFEVNSTKILFQTHGVNCCEEKNEHETVPSLGYSDSSIYNVPIPVVSNLCYNCGFTGHWANKCFKPKVTCKICECEGHMACYCAKVKKYNQLNSSRYSRSDQDHNWRSSPKQNENTIVTENVKSSTDHKSETESCQRISGFIKELCEFKNKKRAEIETVKSSNVYESETTQLQESPRVIEKQNLFKSTQHVISNDDKFRANLKFESFYEDEISLNVDEHVNVDYLDVSGKFAHIQRNDGKEGWIPNNTLSFCGFTVEKVENKKVVPLRLQQYFRQRRIAQLCEKARALKKVNSEHFSVTNKTQIPILLKKGVTVNANCSQLVEVMPTRVCSDFLMIKPTDSFLTHKSLEVLDGSYYVNKGGYMMVHNRSLQPFDLKQGIEIGIGEVIEKSEIPFMDNETIEICNFEVDSSTSKRDNNDDDLSVKEKSRTEFRKVREFRTCRAR